MRILHFGLSHNTGGIERSLLRLAQHVDRQQFDFDFLDLTGGAACFRDELIELGGRFHNVTPRSVSPWQNRRQLRTLFREEHFDVLHLHVNTLSYVQPARIALRVGIPVIIHSRAAGWPNLGVRRVLHEANRHFLPWPQIERVAVSRQAGDWLFGRKSDFKVVNNGIDVERFAFTDARRSQMRSALGLSDKFIVGHVGMFSPVKNHSFLLQTFEAISRSRNDAVLILIGEGPLKEDIKAETARRGLDEKVRFLGSRRDVPELLAAMDLLVFPSISEGFPNTILEAQCAGLPCLVSDNVTPEVVLSADCLRLPLDSGAEYWASLVPRIEGCRDRSAGAQRIRDAGMSVESEVEEIQSLYRAIETYRSASIF